jgi:hypothetical protein
MTNWRNTTAPPTYDGLTAAIAELKAELASRSRDVFVYPGSIDAFKADLEASGIEIRGTVVMVSGVALFPYGLCPVGSLECCEIDGQVWVAGSPWDFQDARNGKIPVKLLRPGGSQC